MTNFNSLDWVGVNQPNKADNILFVYSLFIQEYGTKTNLKIKYTELLI